MYTYPFLLAILNSSVIRYELNANRRSNIHIYPEDWKTLKIPKLDTQDGISFEIKEKVEIIINHNNVFQERNSNFLKYIQSKYQIEIFSRKLQNWHELAFSEFIKELNNVIKKSVAEKLSKSDEMEWMELFEKKKAEAQTLKSDIDKTDREIDQMVYELYGLTHEEIRIVEGTIE